MRSKLGGIIVGIGLGLLVVFLMADVIGIGTSPGFGGPQVVGSVVGLLVMAFGLWFTLKKKQEGSEAE